MTEQPTPGVVIRRLLAFIAAAAVLALGIAARGESIRLHGEAGAAGPAIRLADVAELDGERAERLSGVVVASFEARAKQMRITLDGVREALGQAGVNWGMVSLKGFNTCLVHRLDAPAEVETPEPAEPASANVENVVAIDSDPASPALRALVLDKLAQFAGVSPDDLRITFIDRDEEVLKQGSPADRFEIEPRSSGRIGRVPVTITRYRGDRAVEELSVTADVERRAMAAVVTRSISKGDVFTSDAVEVREVFLKDERHQGQPVSDLKLLLGQASSMQLRAGAVVYPTAVESPVLIRRGELVTVRCMSGGLVVRTVARSVADGRLNDVIEVRNEATRQTYAVAVTGRQEATIRLGAEAERDTAANSEGSLE